MTGRRNRVSNARRPLIDFLHRRGVVRLREVHQPNVDAVVVEGVHGLASILRDSGPNLRASLSAIQLLQLGGDRRRVKRALRRRDLVPHYQDIR